MHIIIVWRWGETERLLRLLPRDEWPRPSRHRAGMIVAWRDKWLGKGFSLSYFLPDLFRGWHRCGHLLYALSILSAHDPKKHTECTFRNWLSNILFWVVCQNRFVMPLLISLLFVSSTNGIFTNQGMNMYFVMIESCSVLVVGCSNWNYFSEV
jgi:hypothetical protein